MLRRVVLAAALMTGIDPARATDTAPPPETLVITATRVPQPSFDQPAAISTVDRGTIADAQLEVNLSETLDRVPGLIVQNREDYAQDLQISSRGFGARASFGILGIRILVDGIPATQPDGQGQVTNIDLGSAQRIEILRGPFSALYGNAAGGVISIITEDGKPGSAIDGKAEFGSFGLVRGAVKLSGAQGGSSYTADIVDFHTGGYRIHSGADRRNFNGKWRLTIDDSADLTMIANAVQGSADDPLGLTHAQFDTDPRQAGTGAIAFDTRKYVAQEQFGLALRKDLGSHDSLQSTLYGGNRDVTQYQAIPVATQISPSSPGGVIDLGVGFAGGDVHVTDERHFAGIETQLTAGIDYDSLSEGRRGYQNFIAAASGVEGALRRDETDDVGDFDQYVQAQLRPGAGLLVEAGLRNSTVRVSSRDHYIVPGNGDDSGGVAYHAATPALGISYAAADKLRLYAAYGRGFETPTLDELAYRSTSGSVTGLNFGLRPSTSDDYEIGAKAVIGKVVRLDAALFHIDTRNELAIAANTAGRAVYQNVGQTRRDGVELGATGEWPDGIGMAFAYTYLRAVYAQAFTSCPSLPCVATVVPAGNRVPGVPLHSAYGELSWHDRRSGFSAAIETRVASRVYVDDPNSDTAPFYLIANLRFGLAQSIDGTSLEEFLRIDNIGDRRYAGAVIVNESNRRFFEPAAGRALYVGVTAHF